MLGWIRRKQIRVLAPMDGYNRWASTYSHESNPIKDYSNQFVEQFLPNLESRALLDVGCGTGYFCALAEKKGAARIVGIDLSASMLEQARMNCKTAEFYQADLTNLDIPHDSFDVVICALVLAHLQDISHTFSNLSRLMVTGGTLIVTDFHPFLTQQNAKRTFKDPQTNTTFEIKHFLHPLPEIIAFVTTSGLHIDQMDEPTWNDKPLIYALKASKR